jgi:hypothetical protein
MKTVANFLMFYLGWFACVVGAARGLPWAGPLVVAALLVIHLQFTPSRRREARLIALVGLLGFGVDTLQASAGFYSFADAGAAAWLCPPWMVALWLIFATTLNRSMGWLSGRPVLAAILGGVFGPLSYLAGARLGAIELNPDPLYAFSGIAVAWSIALPATFLLARSLEASPAEIEGPRTSTRKRLAGPMAGAVLLTLGFARTGSAAEIEGVIFAERYESGGASLDLRCTALLRYKVLFKGYVAALYLEGGVAADDALTDVPKRLELSYFWSIDGEDIRRVGDQILAQNVDAETLAALRPRLDLLNSWYADVKPGDRYSLTYIPGRGTELALNGQAKGVIPGFDFADAYFRIWLGERPIDTSLRDQLLACSKTT